LIQSSTRDDATNSTGKLRFREGFLWFRYIQIRKHIASALMDRVPLTHDCSPLRWRRHPYGIDRTERVTVMIHDDLQHPYTGKAFERFRIKMFVAQLGQIEGIAHELTHLLRKRAQIILGGAHPKQRFRLGRAGHASNMLFLA
jgi:hypothetical protein